MSLHPHLPHFRHLVRPQLWRDRAVIWVGAVITGLCVVGFVQLTDLATEQFTHMREAWPWLPLLVTPLGGMLVVWLTRRFAETAAGSGIPQVMAALNPNLPAGNTSRFVSLKLSLAKALLGASAIAAGFSAGREGPCVQLASGVLTGFHKLVKRQIAIKQRDLILAGGAAGMAAAFNAPLAGIVFAIEELGKQFEERSSGLLITAIMLSGLVAISLMGNLTYFGRIRVEQFTADLVEPALLVSLLVGLLGGLFSRLMVNSFAKSSWRVNQWRGRWPIRFAGACGLVVAVLGIISDGAAFGSGYSWSRALLSEEGHVPVGYFLIKLVATWLSFWSGIPGGLFAPTLAVGAGVGHDVALLTGTAVSAPIIALGMAGFLAAVTQAPITSFIIVMEMTDGHAMVLSLMATALFSSVVSRLISAPLYPSLAMLQLQRLGTVPSKTEREQERERESEA